MGELLGTQGVSTAGAMLGLGDGRTILVKEVWRCWDEAPARRCGRRRGLKSVPQKV